MFQEEKDRIRANFNKYVQKAFEALPPLDRPRILDIGCGSGVPTLELARLSNGEIIALDIAPPMIEWLLKKVDKAGLADRVTVLHRSMFDMGFPDESFDVVWAEGSIHVIGFKRGLLDWRPLLKQGGYLVVHDELDDIDEKMEQVSHSGYELVTHFVLDENVWRDEYFAPLEKLINRLRKKHSDDDRELAELNMEQREVDAWKSDPVANRSAYFIMKKVG